MAAFDAICSAQKDRRLGAADLTLPYPTLPYLRKVRTSVQFGVDNEQTRLRAQGSIFSRRPLDAPLSTLAWCAGACQHESRAGRHGLLPQGARLGRE